VAVKTLKSLTMHFDTAWRTIQGLEAMHQLRKVQIVDTTMGNTQSQIRFVSNVFGVAA